MSIERKQLFAHLASGDCKIIATRHVPFPHRYMLDHRGCVEEVGEEATRELVEMRVASGRPLDALWDSLVFDIDVAGARLEAFTYSKHGFGRCAVCGAFPLAAGVNANAPRHGTTGGTPPCEGSGKPLVDVVRAPEAVSDAA